MARVTNMDKREAFHSLVKVSMLVDWSSRSLIKSLHFLIKSPCWLTKSPHHWRFVFTQWRHKYLRLIRSNIPLYKTSLVKIARNYIDGTSNFQKSQIKFTKQFLIQLSYDPNKLCKTVSQRSKRNYTKHSSRNYEQSYTICLSVTKLNWPPWSYGRADHPPQPYGSISSALRPSALQPYKSLYLGLQLNGFGLLPLDVMAHQFIVCLAPKGFKVEALRLHLPRR